MKEKETPKMNIFSIPEDGKDIFQIGNHTFKITESEFCIAKMTHEFYAEIKAQLKKPKKAIKEELLDDYDENGEISWQFACLGVHRGGIPTAKFTLEEDKTTNPYFYLRRDGFQYSLSFYGEITFRDGWMGCNGYLKPSYDDSPVFPVRLNVSE